MNWKILFVVIGCGFSGIEMVSGQTILNITPGFGAPGEQIFIQGFGFAGSTNVRFTLNKNVPVTPPSDLAFNVVVPAGATTGPLQMVKNGVVGPASMQSFIVIGQEPYITGFAPNFGAPGAVNIIISGTHFTGITNVSFNGTRVTGFGVTAETQLHVTNLPAGITTGPISLTRSNLTGTSSSYFFVAPSIASFSPSSGRVGNVVVIKGQNFTGATAVTFNSVNAPGFVVNSNTQITVSVPTNATTGRIGVTTPAAQVLSSSNFVVSPTIYSFSPAFGKPGTNVTILGANLLGNTAVSFNGVNAVVGGGGTSNQITATVPAAATSGPITVTTTNGSFTTVSNFFLPPAISSFTPLFGNVGTSVSLQGSNFTYASAVSFSGIAANFTVVNNTRITATVPSGATTGPISVTTPGGSASAVAAFYLPPVISGLNPANGFPLTQVTVSGTNFLQATAVKFNGVSASYSVSNNNRIVATVPATATTGAISVTAPGGTGTSGTFVVNVVTLTIAWLTNRAVQISWPTNAVGFALQGNTNLSTTNWAVLTNVPAISNGTNYVTNSIAKSPHFFRLRK